MPVASALFVKSAWTWFVAGIALGAALAFHKATGWRPDLAARIYSTHVHLLLVGFVAQWIMGIAFWLYPRGERTGFAPHHRRVLVAWALLNTGVLARAVAEAMVLSPALQTWKAWWGVYLAATGFQALAGLLYVTAIWGRIHCSLRLPEGRVRDHRLLRSVRKVWNREEVE